MKRLLLNVITSSYPIFDILYICASLNSPWTNKRSSLFIRDVRSKKLFARSIIIIITIIISFEIISDI